MSRIRWCFIVLLYLCKSYHDSRLSWENVVIKAEKLREKTRIFFLRYKYCDSDDDKQSRSKFMTLQLQWTTAMYVWVFRTSNFWWKHQIAEKIWNLAAEGVKEGTPFNLSFSSCYLLSWPRWWEWLWKFEWHLRKGPLNARWSHRLLCVFSPQWVGCHTAQRQRRSTEFRRCRNQRWSGTWRRCSRSQQMWATSVKTLGSLPCTGKFCCEWGEQPRRNWWRWWQCQPEQLRWSLVQSWLPYPEVVRGIFHWFHRMLWKFLLVCQDFPLRVLWRKATSSVP